ncbi:hypothetical protein GCM10017786_31410 [Amycolatopsis deserti]|uniref:DUF4352 domain-containing protein n=1 Tax=Amycolatopsis deserti TaxID=185696 RepID=A0ABQ3IZ92_9PSEU|nr:hypothetical protein [Amycolatopsis deserti]GHE96529.1 hypothetical protein GCM10017786_31410 [Amycolatopsis deserti]
MRHLVPAVAIALLLTGCSSSSQSDGGVPFQPKPTAPASASTSGQSETNGYTKLRLGDTAELSAKADGSQPATWTIEKIEIDPPCNGSTGTKHVLLLHVRANTGPDKNAAELIPEAFRYTSFAEPGENGGTTPANVSLCQSKEPGSGPLPVPYQRNQELTGTVALVVPEANGTLIQNSPGITGEGWEWWYPGR